VILNPTQIYVDPVIDLLQHLDAGHLGGRSSVRGLCHVTGGGLSNLLRLHPTLGWRIDTPLPVLPEFAWLQEAGGVETREMYRTFNMGMGMVLAVDAAHAEGVAAWLSQRMPGSAVVGTVVSDGAPSVVHVPTGSTFSHY
jgi:phosphoribosylformylglycinamidine cyclo-ligase